MAKYDKIAPQNFRQEDTRSLSSSVNVDGFIFKFKGNQAIDQKGNRMSLSSFCNIIAGNQYLIDEVRFIINSQKNHQLLFK